MIYPKIPDKLDKRKKLTSEQIKEIKYLYSAGNSKVSISKKYKVSVSLLCYHLNGEDYKKKWNDKIKKRHKEKMKIAEYREKQKINSNKSKKYKRSVDDKLSKYQVCFNKNWRNKNERNRNRWNEYNKVRRGNQDKLSILI